MIFGLYEIEFDIILEDEKYQVLFQIYYIKQVDMNL
jgi:hypothetical protein